MRHRAPMPSNRGTVATTGATATGATATAAASLASIAVGAIAVGALAVGAVAVGRLTIGRARLRRVEIGELAVGRLAIGTASTGDDARAICRVRAASGRGDDLERLVVASLARIGPGALPYRARRSSTDSDAFLFVETAAAPTPGSDPEPRFAAVLREAAGRGLLAREGPGAVESFLTI